jgi:hypothetical protein
MNPFEKHGIKHLSPSSLNLWQGEPALWVMRYLHGTRDDAGPAAKRGQAVEAGLDLFLMGQKDFDACCKAARDNFELNTGGVIDEAHDDERDVIVPMLAQAMSVMRDSPPLLARQVRVEAWLDGIDVPVMGYCDYVLENKVIVDLKTTHRLPSKPKPDHVRQVALYAHARQAPVTLLYVTKAKSARYAIAETECAEALADLTRVARSLRKMLAAAGDKTEAAEFVAPNFENFYWTPETITAAKDIWK